METSEYKGIRIMRERVCNFNWTVKQLERCSRVHNGYEECPYLEECVKRYDQRCQVWSVRRYLQLTVVRVPNKNKEDR